ncbi:MAG: flagellar hook capping FlgD N-terminal domain-containing protein [Hyphomonadaceae bacterium]
MPITPIATTPAESAGSRQRLSDNYDTFLVLLTAQLQNQDPLAPMDSTEFTQQLVQYSQVEQQIRTNEQLEGLVGQYQAASAGAALSYLGATPSFRPAKPISPAAKPTGPTTCRRNAET